MKHIALLLALAVVIVGCQATPAEPQATLTSGDYALLVGPWEGDLVSKSPDGTVRWQSELKLVIVENGLGRFSAAATNREWGTIVKIERGVVILHIDYDEREFVYAQEGDTATLSASYRAEFQGNPRINDIKLKKTY